MYTIKDKNGNALISSLGEYDKNFLRNFYKEQYGEDIVITEEYIRPTDFIIINEKNEKMELEILQEENRILKTQVQAMTENQTFLEDCIVELAQEVYK